jgi:hypothetical protein
MRFSIGSPILEEKNCINLFGTEGLLEWLEWSMELQSRLSSNGNNLRTTQQINLATDLLNEWQNRLLKFGIVYLQAQNQIYSLCSILIEAGTREQ